MARAFAPFGMSVALHKHYGADELVGLLAGSPGRVLFLSASTHGGMHHTLGYVAERAGREYLGGTSTHPSPSKSPAAIHEAATDPTGHCGAVATAHVPAPSLIISSHCGVALDDAAAIGEGAALERHCGFSTVAALERAWLAQPADTDIGVD